MQGSEVDGNKQRHQRNNRKDDLHLTSANTKIPSPVSAGSGWSIFVCAQNLVPAPKVPTAGFEPATPWSRVQIYHAYDFWRSSQADPYGDCPQEGTHIVYHRARRYPKGRAVSVAGMASNRPSLASSVIVLASWLQCGETGVKVHQLAELHQPVWHNGSTCARTATRRRRHTSHERSGATPLAGRIERRHRLIAGRE